MKRTGNLASAIAALVLVSFTASAGDKSTDMTESDWKQFAQVISTQDEAQVTATIGLTQEATCFFAFLATSSALTATPTNIVKEFFVAPYPATFVAKYPLKMVAEVQLRDAAAGKQRYFMEKPTSNTLWRLTEGWSISTNGQKGTALPLPSETTQKEANTLASEAAKEQE